MALIKCPECGKEISDSNNACPFCGYVLKRDTKRKTLLIALVIIVICAAIAIAVYSLVIHPNELLKQAENLISRGKYSEADVILTGLPDSSKKTELVTKIVLYDAQEALDSGDYELAEKTISMLPEDAVDVELLYEIKTQQANALLGQGRYSEADALYAELEQTEDVKSIREQLFYESRILHCAAMAQDVLLNPETMKIDEVLVLEGSSSLDESASDSQKEVYQINEPRILIHYRAQARGGSMVDGFRLFDWEDGKYDMGIDVDSLTMDKEKPWNYEYMDDQEKKEYLNQQLEILRISLVVYLPEVGSYDLERVNSVVAGGYAADVEMLAYNDVVPEPTLKIVDVTPEPTEEVAAEAPAEEPTAEEPAAEGPVT